MKSSFLSIWGLMILSFFSEAQHYEKVYLDQSDSTRFYFKVTPDLQAEGLLVLLPGSRGDAEWPLKTTKIPYLAADSGLVTIMINYEIWVGWLCDDILDLLNKS
jgi:poly(3-hydroxybutyrate) depolymerase